MPSPRILTRLGALGALALGVRWAVGPPYREGVRRGPVREFEGVIPGVHPADRLRVVSWNIAWGYGWGSEGKGGPRPAAVMRARVDAMGEVLASLRPDVVLLQEVDFDCGRSGRIDEAEILARAASLPWIAPALSWEVGYVPFPGASPRGHWGRMRSGGAILSRLPLRDARVLLLPRPGANSFLYNVFYLRRYLQRVWVDAPFGPVEAANLHLDAFDRAARVRQSRIVAAELGGDGPLVVGGDFNTVPPEATVRRAYVDEPDTDHEGDSTLPVFRGIPRFVEVEAPAPEAAGFTFPAHAPNRRLDHAFVRELRAGPSRVAGEAGDLSDHLPIVFDIHPGGDPAGGGGAP